MSQDKVIVKVGLGFCGLLFIVLLLLKVGVVETQAVAWSWWVIFAPLASGAAMSNLKMRAARAIRSALSRSRINRKEGLMSQEDKVVIEKKGIGFCGLLFIVLLLLKVGVVETQAVAWSWWVIFAPLWVPLAIVASIFAIIILAMLGVALVSYFGDK